MAELGTDRLVVAPDPPGYGASDPPPKPLSIANYAAAQSFCEQVHTAVYYIDYEFEPIWGEYLDGAVTVTGWCQLRVASSFLL